LEDVKQNYGDLSRDFLTFCSVNILGIFLLDLHKLHWPIFEFLSSAMVVSLLRSKPVNVRVVLISIFVFVALLTAHAQTDELSIDEAIQLGQQYIDENVDPEVVKVLNNLELGGASDFFSELEAKLNREYVIDLVGLKKTAASILPLLEAHEETQPYAAWLKAQMDYLDAAERLKKLMPPPSAEKKPTVAPKPTPVLQKKVWVMILNERPVPKEAQPYVTKLKPVFAAEGLPEELVWLAELESGFNPKAKSPSGAAGLYQLMPKTAKSLGLSTFLPDERYNPDKATPAMAKYLKRLYRQFKDWKLTLAAYNAGEGRVDSLMKKYKADSFDTLWPRLPAETQMYIPRFDAILQKREGIALTALAAPKMEQSK